MSGDGRRGSVPRRFTYAVRIAGVLGPALVAAFPSSHVTTTSPSTLFRLRLPSEMGQAQIAAVLAAKGLVMLSAREVQDRDTMPKRPDSPIR